MTDRYLWKAISGQRNHSAKILRAPDMCKDQQGDEWVWSGVNEATCIGRRQIRYGARRQCRHWHRVGWGTLEEVWAEEKYDLIYIFRASFCLLVGKPPFMRQEYKEGNWLQSCYNTLCKRWWLEPRWMQGNGEKWFSGSTDSRHNHDLLESRKLAQYLSDLGGSFHPPRASFSSSIK